MSKIKNYDYGVSHQLVTFGQKYPPEPEWNNVGFPGEFYDHCWQTVSNNFATGLPSEHTTGSDGYFDLCSTPARPSNIQVPDAGWNLWHAVEYQRVKPGGQLVEVTEPGVGVKGKPVVKKGKPTKYIPRRYFARCRGRNDFLANLCVHLDRLFTRIRDSGGPILASDPGPLSRTTDKLPSLDLGAALEKVPDDEMAGKTAEEGATTDQEKRILSLIGIIWGDQQLAYERIRVWAHGCCVALGVRVCQTMDAVFLNGVSALLTVYKAHAVLYETLLVPTENFTNHCDLKIQSAELVDELDINSRKRRKACLKGGLVGPVITNLVEPYEPDEAGLQVLSL